MVYILNRIEPVRPQLFTPHLTPKRIIVVVLSLIIRSRHLSVSSNLKVSQSDCVFDINRVDHCIKRLGILVCN